MLYLAPLRKTTAEPTLEFHAFNAEYIVKLRNGDVATLATPTGDQEIEILKVRYRPQA